MTAEITPILEEKLERYKDLRFGFNNKKEELMEMSSYWEERLYARPDDMIGQLLRAAEAVNEEVRKLSDDFLWDYSLRFFYSGLPQRGEENPIQYLFDAYKKVQEFYLKMEKSIGKNVVLLHKTDLIESGSIRGVLDVFKENDTQIMHGLVLPVDGYQTHTCRHPLSRHEGHIDIPHNLFLPKTSYELCTGEKASSIMDQL